MLYAAGLGAAALYWVARKQKAGEVSVLGLEQYDLFHHRGGSQDHSRIIRLAQSAPWYTKIAPHMYFALLPRGVQQQGLELSSTHLYTHCTAGTWYDLVAT